MSNNGIKYKRIKYKKGVFLTLISISIIMIIVIISKRDSAKTDEISADQLRVIQLNNFLNDLQHNYLERSMYTSSHRAITSLNLYILKTGSLLDSLNPKFSEVVMSGKIEGTDIDSITGEELMKDNNLQDWISKIEEVTSESFKSRLNITINSVGIFQSSPWIISAVANVSINLTDAIANWTIEDLIIVTDMDVGDFQDPLFIYKFKGRYNHKINKSNVHNEWNTAAFNEHIRNGNYVFWGKGNSPSFLMRFTKNAIDSSLVSECCGIESVIDGKKAATEGFGGAKHSIDYLFFRNIGCDNTKLFSVNSVDIAHQPVYFDLENIGKYKISPEEINDACTKGT